MHSLYHYVFADCTTTEKAEIVFLIDSSKSIGKLKFNVLLAFINTLIDNFKIGINNVRVGAITFSSGVSSSVCHYIMNENIVNMSIIINVTCIYEVYVFPKVNH